MPWRAFPAETCCVSPAGTSSPSTWDELLTAARDLTTGDLYGIALNQDASYAWPWLL